MPAKCPFGIGSDHCQFSRPSSQFTGVDAVTAVACHCPPEPPLALQGSMFVSLCIPRVEACDLRPEVPQEQSLVISSGHKASFLMLEVGAGLLGGIAVEAPASIWSTLPSLCPPSCLAAVGCRRGHGPPAAEPDASEAAGGGRAQVGARTEMELRCSEAG